MQSRNIVPGIPGLNSPMLVPNEQDPAFAQTRTLNGVVRDANGNPLSGATVKLFSTGGDVLVGQTTSNASGAFTFAVPYGNYYIVAYLAGTPDRAGTTVNTLQGV